MPRWVPHPIHDAGVCEEMPWGKDQLSELWIRGWREVSATGLHWQGSCKGSVFFTDTGKKPCWTDRREPFSFWHSGIPQPASGRFCKNNIRTTSFCHTHIYVWFHQLYIIVWKQTIELKNNLWPEGCSTGEGGVFRRGRRRKNEGKLGIRYGLVR